VTTPFLGFVSIVFIVLQLLWTDYVNIYITVLHPSLRMAFFEKPDHWDPDIAERARQILDKKAEEYAKDLAASKKADEDPKSSTPVPASNGDRMQSVHQLIFHRAASSVTNTIKKTMSSAQEEIKLYITTTPGAGELPILDILIW
jgi:hypothetical protein